jgi:hypothetical protein
MSPVYTPGLHKPLEAVLADFTDGAFLGGLRPRAWHARKDTKEFDTLSFIARSAGGRQRYPTHNARLRSVPIAWRDNRK